MPPNNLPNLFNKKDAEDIIARIEKLKATSERQWGKMSVDQMLAHCAEVMRAATGDLVMKRSFLSYTIGPLVKGIYSNERPFARSTPTDKAFTITDARKFGEERQRLIALINQFSDGGPAKATKHAHSFFGKLTAQEWARGMYKHLDHHLRQFGY